MPKISNLVELLEHTRVEGDCLVWTGFRYPKTGYGQCYIGADRSSHPKYSGAHRLVWMFHCGEIPKGRVIMHMCDNPPCVKIEHLRLGSVSDNQKDMSLKGRSWRGSRHHNATTDEATVKRIRARYSETPRKYGSIANIAREFNLSFSTTYQIVTKSSWRHVT